MIQLHDIISPQTLKIILIYVILFLAATVSLLLLALIADKLHSEWREKRKQRLKHVFIDAIAAYQLTGELEVKHPRRRLEYEALADVCIDVLLSISGGTADRIKELMRSLALIDYYKKVATSPSWLKRYYAIEKLGFLRLAELKDYFLEFLKDEKRYEVRAKALWGLSLIADPEVLETVTEILSQDASRSAKFNEYVYSNIIQSFRHAGLIEGLISFLEDLRLDSQVPAILKRDIIEACGSSALHEAVEVIAKYYPADHENPEIKITCIRALGKLGGAGAEEIIQSGFSDADWRIRAVAASSAYLCNEQVVPMLRQLLYDPVYFVRINASKSLARLGETGLSALEAEVDSADRFVRDTVRFMLEEKVRYA